MKTLILRLISICLFSVVALTGWASRGSEFLGSWVNTTNPNDTFQIMRNGDEYLIVSPDQKREWELSIRMEPLEIKGALLSTEHTYVKRTDTLVGPGFFGQVKYKRQK